MKAILALASCLFAVRVAALPAFLVDRAEEDELCSTGTVITSTIYTTTYETATALASASVRSQQETPQSTTSVDVSASSLSPQEPSASTVLESSDASTNPPATQSVYSPSAASPTATVSSSPVSVPPTTSYYVPPSSTRSSTTSSTHASSSPTSAATSSFASTRETTSSSASPSTTTSSSPVETSAAASATGVSGYSNSLYFTNWGIYGADFQPQQIPASNVNRILYAFADIGSDGTVQSSDSYADVEKHYPEDSWSDSGTNAYGCVKQLFALKQQNRHLKVLLSIGGWTYSSKFPPVAATETGRQTFAQSAVQLVADWGFDGIDIDWEYPASADEASDFVLLLKACREALDTYAAESAPGYHFLITIASPAGPQNYNIMDIKGMDPYVDAWNLMAYDYAGSWDTTSGHQANIYTDPSNPTATKYSTEKALEDYEAKGIAAHKIMLGLPLYGRSFEDTRGLGLAYSGVGTGTTEAGIWLYKGLPRAGATELYDDVAKASYSYDASTLELISYDNVASAKEKTTYLQQKGLGGAVYWEASGDRNDSQSLVGTVAAQLGGVESSQNLLSFPASKYDNIKNGLSSS